MTWRHKVKPLTTRSEIFETDLYRMNNVGRYGSRRVKDVHRLQLLHATKLSSESSPDFPSEFKPEHIHIGDHICDSNANPAIYCVYHEIMDPLHDYCAYCGQPHERK